MKFPQVFRQGLALVPLLCLVPFCAVVSARQVLRGLASVTAPKQVPITRTLAFRIKATNPAAFPNLVKRIQVCIKNESGTPLNLPGWPHDCQAVTGTELLAQINLPASLQARLRAQINLELHDPVKPNHQFLTRTLDFTDPRNLQSAVIEREYTFVQFEITSQIKVYENNRWINQPTPSTITVFGKNPDTSAPVSLFEVMQSGFEALRASGGTLPGSLKFYLPLDVSLRDFALPFRTEGKLRLPTGQMDRIAQGLTPASATSGRVSVDLLYEDPLETLRARMYSLLVNDLGFDRSTASRISNVPIERKNIGSRGRRQPGGRIEIASNFDFLKFKEDGDTLLHEWTHHLYNTIGLQAENVGGSHPAVRAPARTRHLAWDEGLMHFIGSYLLALRLQQTGATELVHTNGGDLLDDAADRNREEAITKWRGKVNPEDASVVMNVPGEWIEGLVAGALIEWYRAEGLADPSVDALPMLQRAYQELKQFFSANLGQRTTWTVSDYFLFRRAKLSVERRRLIDQLLLWYLLTERATIERLEPTSTLIPTQLKLALAPGTTAKAGDPIPLLVSVRALDRLIGAHRRYSGSSLKVRLYEGALQLGGELPLGTDRPETGFNAAKLMQWKWSDAGPHRIHAEIWSDFLDGRLERLGRSNEVEVVIEKDKPLPVTITISPAAITLEPEAVTPFTVKVTGTTNPAVMIEATKNELRSEAGTLTQIGPETWSYQAPSYPGTVLIKATSRADNKQSATATVTVKPPAAASGIPYSANVVQVPCVWAMKDTCDNNRVVFPLSRLNNSSPLIVSLAIPPGLSADSLKDLPLQWRVEYSKLTTPQIDSQGVNRLNCPPAAKLTSTGGGGLRMGPDKVLGNQALYQSTLSTEDLENAQIKVWLEVTDNVQRSPRYQWNYKKGDRWLLYSAALPTCGTGGQPAIAGTPTQPAQPATTPAPLTVKLTASRTLLGFGEQAKVQAHITGGTPPYKLYWHGQHIGEGEAVTFVSATAGSQALTLNVTDAKGAGVTQSILFTVSGMEVVLEKIAPTGDRVVFGASASVVAKIRSGGQPSTGTYFYRWQPQPEVSFTPPEGTQATAMATFLRPGKVSLWVSVLENKQGQLVTVAESQPLELIVTPPAFELVFDPPAPYIGQETRAKILLRQPLPPDRIAFKWELPPNAKLLREAENVREIIFLPSNDVPLNITVRAAVPHYGDSLGQATATVQARPYDVKAITVTKPPYAVSQNVELLATIKPETARSPVRFIWDVTADSNNHIVGQNAGKTMTINRSEAGICAIVLEAFDGNGFRIGRDTTSFQVTITQANLKAKDAAAKVAEAKLLVRKGKLDEAITLVEEAAKLDPTNTEAALLGKKWKDERTQIQQHLARVRALWAESRYKAAQQELMAAQNLHWTYPPVEEIARQFNEAWTTYQNNVKADLDAIQLSNEAREFRQSLNLAQMMRAKWKLYDHDLTRLNTLEQEAKKREAEKDRQRAILKRGEAKLRQQDYAGAIADFEVMHANGEFYQHWSIYQEEPHYYEKLRAEAHQKLTRINELLVAIRRVIDAPNVAPEIVEKTRKSCDEVLSLQAANADAQRYCALLTDRLKGKRAGAEANALLALGVELFTQKKYAEAKAVLDEAIAFQPQLSEAWRRRGMTKREMKDYAGAIADFTQALVLEPTNHRTFTGRGLAREENGDVRGALEDYSRAIQIKPDYENAWFNRAFLKAKQKDYAGAVSDYDQVLTLNPKQVDATNNRGAAKENLGDLNGARRDYERALELKPDYEMARKNLERVKGKLTAANVVTKDKEIPKERETTTPDPIAIFLDAVLENQSSENVHIFVEGESFSPANRLTPGAKRTAAIKVPVSGRVKFVAGRDGQVLTTKVWEGDPNQPKRYPRVIFTRDGMLVILTSLR